MPSPPAPRPRRFSWPLALFSIAFVLILAALFLFYRVETWPMRNARAATEELERLGQKARDAFVELAQLQPRVTINDRVYFEQTSGVAELALLSRRTEVEREFTHTWAGSTKRVQLHGTFEVKAGFDLRENLEVEIGDEIIVRMPPAQVLTVEQRQVEVLQFENGYWNRISAADLEKELAALPALAREKASRSDLLAETENALRQQLENRLGTERPLRILFGEAQSTKP